MNQLHREQILLSVDPLFSASVTPKRYGKGKGEASLTAKGKGKGEAGKRDAGKGEAGEGEGGNGEGRKRQEGGSEALLLQRRSQGGTGSTF